MNKLIIGACLLLAACNTSPSAMCADPNTIAALQKTNPFGKIEYTDIVYEGMRPGNQVVCSATVSLGATGDQKLDNMLRALSKAEAKRTVYTISPDASNTQRSIVRILQ